MEETVECAECGNRYDSSAHAFCPRCGSDSGASAVQAVSTSRPADPRRRRAQAGGVILLILGGLVLVQSMWTVVAPPSPDAQQLELLSGVDVLRDQPGGSLMLHVTDNGTGVDGAVVTLARLNGTVTHNGTTTGGWTNMSSLPAAFMNVSVAWQGQTWSRHVYVPVGQGLTVEIDVAEDDPGTVAWEAVEQVAATRVLSGFLALFAAFVVLGGVMALRLRYWGIAIAAAILALLPALLIVAVIPVAGLLFLLPTAAATLLVAMGKPHFT